MAVDLVSDIDISVQYVVIQFGASVRTSTITNDKFLVATDAATPVSIADPFMDIALNEDYDDIGRVLRLTWNDDVLEPTTDYTLTLSGLQNVLGQDFDDWTVQFTTGDTVNSALDGLPPPPAVVSVIDHSIVSSVFDKITIPVANLPFQVLESDPPDGDYYIPADYNRGRIKITFTADLSSSSVNSSTVKAQRRPIKRGPSRWETLDAHVSTSGKYLYVDLPSTDLYPATPDYPQDAPVYYTPDYTYFDENYKYRVLLSKDISN